MAFFVGQEIECIDDSPTKQGTIVSIKKGWRYRVAGHSGDRYGAAICLEEIPLKAAPSAETGWYYEKRFRPLVERKTDISVFTAMLNPSKEKVG